MPIFVGTPGNDVLVGTIGNDGIYGLGGADQMTGDGGDDVYDVDDAGDSVVEADPAGGIDTVRSSIGYTLGGNLEKLVLIGAGAIDGTGNALANIVFGNDVSNRLDGGAGADSLRGRGGDDTYVVDDAGDYAIETDAADGTDTVQSSVSFTLGGHVENLVLTGADAINGIGNGLDNVISGNGAANLLSGGGGADAMSGGDGNDLYFIDNVGDQAIETSATGGSDEVLSTVSHVLGDNIEKLTLTGVAAIDGTGNALDNVITGNNSANVLDGGAGADVMVGNIGDDTYFVDNAGDQTIEASRGGGLDNVFASVSYTLSLFVDNLTLAGTAAINGTGNSLRNIIIGNDAANVLNGGGGNDELYGHDGNDSLANGALLDGGNGDDVLTFGTFMDGGTGADTMTGGRGATLFMVDNVGDVASDQGFNFGSGWRFGAGADIVLSSVTFTLGTGIENLTLTGFAATDGTGNALVNTLTGNGAANRLSGGAGLDHLNGGAGNDTLNGGAGNDVLDGGDGDDTLDGGALGDVMRGGAGNDIYVVDSSGDRVIESAPGEGEDTVRASITHTLGANVENLILEGTALGGIGNALDNEITGNAIANYLNGGGGADLMTGGGGNDTFIVDNSGDVVVEASGEGIDTVRSLFSFTLGANVETLILGGTATEATGNALANTLIGNNVSNILNGGAGADGMRGGNGNDIYIVDNAGDHVVELSAAGGIDLVRSSVSFLLSANVENLELTGIGTANGTGNALDNVISGNGGANQLGGRGGNDTLTGGAGIDTLNGGAGADSLTGGSGIDAFVFNSALDAATNVDAILDFSHVQDSIRLESAVFQKIAIGTLAASAFQSGSQALDADDRILYDSATGQIFYDSDGAGGVVAILFATVNPGTTVTAADFIVY